MNKHTLILIVLISFGIRMNAQEIIPLDTSLWDIKAQSYILENYKGNEAIYLQNGSATAKNTSFLNGTIEFDIFLTERQAFPGVNFRISESGNSEHFYLRPHQSGNPDANQALSVINGIGAWQLYFGETYSFVYHYNFDDWTHVKLIVNGDKAQVFLDYTEKPNLSWILKHEAKAGGISIGGGFAPMHYANLNIDPDANELIDFEIIQNEPVEGAIQEWSVSDKFEEQRLKNLDSLDFLISERKWGNTIEIDETSAANLSWIHSRYGSPGNTVFVKLEITSDIDQVKLFEFGYSDRVVAVLNGSPIYGGNNLWRSRDYRYLGTIGLFDAIYLNLKKGKNQLLFAVSEDFGGWGIMGKFVDSSGIKVKP